MARSVLGSTLAALVGLFTCAGAACADPIRWEFNGSVDSVSGGFPEIDALFPTGGHATFAVTIDPAAAAQCTATTPNCFRYDGRPANEFTFEANIAGHDYFLPNRDGRYSSEAIWVSPTGLSFDNSLSELLGGDRVGTSPSFGPHALDFGIDWPAETFASFALPTALPTSPAAGSFTLYLWTCRDGSPDCVRQDTTISGTLNSAVSVPEPGTLAIVALGLLGLAAVRRVRS